MQEHTEDIYGRFVANVAEGRDMTVEAVDAIAQGRVWTGAEALEIGLVDEIGTLPMRWPTPQGSPEMRISHPGTSFPIPRN